MNDLDYSKDKLFAELHLVIVEIQESIIKKGGELDYLSSLDKLKNIAKNKDCYGLKNVEQYLSQAYRSLYEGGYIKDNLKNLMLEADSLIQKLLTNKDTHSFE